MEAHKCKLCAWVWWTEDSRGEVRTQTSVAVKISKPTFASFCYHCLF